MKGSLVIALPLVLVACSRDKPTATYRDNGEQRQEGAEKGSDPKGRGAYRNKSGSSDQEKTSDNKVRTKAVPTRGRLSVTPITTWEAPKTARYPYLSVAGNRLLLSWVEKVGAKQYALRFTSSKDAVEFTTPKTIGKGKNWFVNWADFPSIVGDKQGNYAAHWLEKNGAGSYSYGVRVACSSDAGGQWGKPFWLHEDTSAAEHGFATLVPEGEGKFSAVWLDGRNQKSTGNMSLRSVRFDHTGRRLGAESLLDDRTCECCATDAAWLGKQGLVTVFRDRSGSESGVSDVRDIAIIRQERPTWTDAAVCHHDLWRNPG